MYVNKFKISTASLINTKSNFLYFNLPISNDNQIVDNGELIDKVFVNEQVDLSINPIIDWEKTRFSPIDANGNKINTIIYNSYLTIKEIQKDSIEIPHPDGVLNIKLPNEFDTSRPLRIKSKGYSNEGRGDLFIKLFVKFKRGL